MAGYADQIIALLEPKVGKVMAISAVKIVCKRKGIDFSDVKKEQIPVLADNLLEPLKVFGGDDFADKMVQEMKQIT